MKQDDVTMYDEYVSIDDREVHSSSIFTPQKYDRHLKELSVKKEYFNFLNLQCFI